MGCPTVGTQRLEAALVAALREVAAKRAIEAAERRRTMRVLTKEGKAA